MDAAFHGFGPDVFGWFDGLERDNSKAYFTATRDLYEAEVRGGLQALLDELSGMFGGEVKLFRQQRNLRFAPKGSPPYKIRTYGLLHGVDGPAAALYAQLSVEGLYAGTGYHQLARDQLERFRDAVVDDHAGSELGAVVAAARADGLDVVGESLRTAPRGYPARPPARGAAAPQGAGRRALAVGRGRHRPRRRAAPRRRRLASGRAAQRVARPARRAQRPAAPLIRLSSPGLRRSS